MAFICCVLCNSPAPPRPTRGVSCLLSGGLLGGREQHCRHRLVCPCCFPPWLQTQGPGLRRDPTGVTVSGSCSLRTSSLPAFFLQVQGCGAPQVSGWKERSSDLGTRHGALLLAGELGGLGQGRVEPEWGREQLDRSCCGSPPLLFLGERCRCPIPPQQPAPPGHELLPAQDPMGAAPCPWIGVAEPLGREARAAALWSQGLGIWTAIFSENLES